MAVSSITRIESDLTPGTTPSLKSESDDRKPTELVPSTVPCAARNCIHKPENAEEKKSKKVENDSDSSSSSSSDSSSESSDSSSDSSSDTEVEDSKKSKSKASTKKLSKAKRRKAKRKAKKTKKVETEPEVEQKAEESKASDSSAMDSSSSALMGALRAALEAFEAAGKKGDSKADATSSSTASKEDASKNESDSNSGSESDAESVKSDSSDKAKKKKKSKKDKKDKKKKAKKASKAEFKRIDEVWDDEARDYKLRETVEEKKKDEFDEYIFTVRRKFDSDGDYEETMVDIKSPVLRESLQKVMANVDSVNLVEEVPKLEPNMLFMYLEDFRIKVAELEKEAKAAKKKERKAISLKAKYLKVLVDYIDKDFEQTKKTLKSLVDGGRITFDLLWALYKPNSLAYSTTYNDDDQPCALKIQSSYKTRSLSKGTYMVVEGKYLDYNGKHFGTAHSYAEVRAFKGTRKINSLACYPLKYHADPEGLKERLIDRGKRFLILAGMSYKNCKGMAYFKKEDNVLKASVNGRVMIDPATFRRINPNYELNDVQPRLIEDDDEEDEDCQCKEESKPKPKPVPEGRMFRLIPGDKTTDGQVVEITAEEQAKEASEVDSAEQEKAIQNTFTEEEILLASAVLPGFSFSEKSWLEFAVSTISDVSWNTGAFDSLVLPEKHKSIVKALVSAHGHHGSKGIDDVIAGKGKGLVAVLHGKPGLGKTLTCEAVSDLLKRPLYTVSAGDLGTNPTTLETELQVILDIAHTWGAVLLLDEADVFLEERSIHDIHRNALVSIFLRLLEYFQGILFLTTNRVNTFDEAFVSRIHLSLRYGDLTSKAKKSVWRTFIEKVRATEGMEVADFSEQDYNDLARCEVNGRQIKNLVKTAQALALHEGVPMGMAHIRQVIEVARSFEMDLKGGGGFEDAMRSYT